MNNHLLPPTTQKSAINTCYQTNERIRNRTLCSIEAIKDCGESVLSQRIEALNYEWDTERVLETNAAAVTLITSVLGLITKRHYMFLLTGTVGAFLLMHALEGWCPPLPIIRKLGVRTAEEIGNEKTICKLLRQDYSKCTDDADEMLDMAEIQ